MKTAVVYESLLISEADYFYTMLIIQKSFFQNFDTMFHANLRIDITYRWSVIEVRMIIIEKWANGSPQL